jgi:hypothetical protein
VAAQGVPLDAKTLKAALARSAECATIEELGRLCDADGAGGGDERVAQHVAGCLRCRTELALLKDFDAAAPRPDEEGAASWITARVDADITEMIGTATPRTIGPARTRRSWRGLLAPRPLAVGIVLAAASLLLVLDLRARDARPPELPLDLGAGSAVFRSSAVTLLSPTDDVGEAPTHLRWEAVRGAASYSVMLMEIDRSEVWQAEARDSAVSLPPAVLARVVPGKPLLWQVVAKDGAGKVVASSQVQRFRLALRESNPKQ